MGLSANNWGWSIGPIDVTEQGKFTFPLFAGASDCDTNNGAEIVGEIRVVAGPGAVDVTFDVSAYNGTLSTTSLYVGTTILPVKANGDFTNAPGQYPYGNNTLPAGTNSSTFMIEDVDLTGEIYIVAYTEVCNTGVTDSPTTTPTSSPTSSPTKVSDVLQSLLWSVRSC